MGKHVRISVILKETDIQRQILDYLSQVGIFTRRNNSGAVKRGSTWVRYGHPGSPDIEGILPDGKYLGIETKTDIGKLSTVQESFHMMVGSMNGVIFVARNLQNVIDKLIELRYIRR